MSKSGSRFTVFLFNILIALLSVAAVAALFFAPLWEIDVKYVMQKEVLEKILPEEAKEVDLDEIVGDRDSALADRLRANQGHYPFRPRQGRQTVRDGTHRK